MYDFVLLPRITLWKSNDLHFYGKNWIPVFAQICFWPENWIMFWNCGSTLSQAGSRLVKRNSVFYLYFGNVTDLFWICKTEKQTHLFLFAFDVWKNYAFPRRKSSDIWLLMNIGTGVFSPCKTRSSNYLLYICITRLSLCTAHRSQPWLLLYPTIPPQARHKWKQKISPILFPHLYQSHFPRNAKFFNQTLKKEIQISRFPAIATMNRHRKWATIIWIFYPTRNGPEDSRSTFTKRSPSILNFISAKPVPTIPDRS